LAWPPSESPFFAPFSGFADRHLGRYAHPVETLFLGFGSMLGPILCATHLLEVWVWLCFRLVQTVEVHCGYDFPWAPNHWVPFWGGAKFHDFHHERFTGNYASTFVVWDAVFGTDDKYRARLRGEDTKKPRTTAAMRTTAIPTTGRVKSE
jgi:sterol desaturase/sphingolipid hydroxylase (fatty acid hydroxylase superfamily)